MIKSVKRLPTHPGDVIKEELEERGITQKQFSEKTGISYTMLNELLNSKRAFSSDVALIVEAALGINAELIMNMQNRYNMAQAKMRPATLHNLEQIRQMCASWLL